MQIRSAFLIVNKSPIDPKIKKINSKQNKMIIEWKFGAEREHNEIWMRLEIHPVRTRLK